MTVGEVRWRRSSDSDELSAQRAIRRVFDAWWGERRRVEPRQLTQPFRITAKGSVWGHFSQIAVWTLRAVGCGAVRHGAEHPRLLLVCDFSHTNMLGQRTISPGKPAQCPDHTKRKPRSGYPLLCAAVRHPSAYVDTEEPRDDVYQYEDEEEEIVDTETTKKDYEAVSYNPPESVQPRTSDSAAKSSRRKLFEDRIPGDHGGRSRLQSQTTPYVEEVKTTRELEAKSKRRKLFEQRANQSKRQRPPSSSEESVEETSQIPDRSTMSTKEDTIDVPEFQPVSEASFYNKLAVQLGSAKAEDGAGRPTPRNRESEEEEYKVVEHNRREDER
ncbi:hypothetical protein MSG28_014109 [Choristoneura fumiferana]|uniref:Uncharacterized protein n=1 Tax=Choristoneura fumiferana TaxID=7141 RepID=A0ACC0JFT8_CHOFU|nr:hypothetical protein MSG28_014109 [Choristoneura fumiferana]